jgi:ubiquinone/menaquinone biosynthesis C-methylase UbiE
MPDQKERFADSESYWRDRATLFSGIYRTWNPLLLATRLFLMHRQRIVARYVPGGHPGLAADVGCGSGEFALFLSGSFARVVAVDYSEMMIEAARERCTAENVTLVRADCTRLPVESGGADALYALGLLDYVADVDGALAEFRRVLKPGGDAIITMPKSPSLFAFLRWGSGARRALFSIPPIVNTWTRSQAEERLRAAGFRLRESTSLWTTMWILHATREP